MDPLTKLPPPPEGSKEALAYGIIASILDCMLNRHIHVLEANGFLNSKKYHAEPPWSGGKKGKTLAIKHDLMDEAQLRFSKQIAEVLKEPNRVAGGN